MPAGQTVFDQIATCYPSNQRSVEMPVMEQVANVIKGRGLRAAGAPLINEPIRRIRDPDRFATYCATKQISIMRAAAGVTSFMNDRMVKEFFMSQNRCIKGVWTTWYDLYAASNADAPAKGNFNMANLYNTWIFHVINGLQPFLTTQLQTLASRFNTASNGTATASLSWPILLDQQQINKNGLPLNELQFVVPSIQVTQQDLTNQIINAIQPIYWAQNLLL